MNSNLTASNTSPTPPDQYGPNFAEQPAGPVEPTPEPPGFDPCLVGNWVTVSILTWKKDEPPDNGSGVHVSYDGTGRQTVDHQGMKPMEWLSLFDGHAMEKIWYTGRSTVRLGVMQPGNYVTYLSAVESPGMVRYEMDNHGEIHESRADDAPGVVSLMPGYVCSDTTLTWEEYSGKVTLKRAP